MQLDLDLSFPLGPKRSTASIVDRGCTRCGRFKDRENILRGDGPDTAEIMFVLDHPDSPSDEMGMPAVGDKDGVLFKRILERCGLARRDIFITYLVKCGHKAPKSSEMRACLPYLISQLQAIQPKLVVCIGKNALKLLTGDKGLNIMLAHGSFFKRTDVPKSIFLPVNGFDAIFADPNVESKIVSDIQRGISEIRNGSLPKLVTNYFKIDSLQKLEQLGELLKNYETLSLDIESNGQKLFFNTEASCWAISWAPGQAAYFPWTRYDARIDTIKPAWNPLMGKRMIAGWKELLKTKLVVLHSGKYDLKILRHQFGIVPKEFIWDTKISSTLIDETMDPFLKTMAWVWTDMGGYESELEHYKRLSNCGFNYARIPEEIIYPYVCGDADCTFRIFKAHKDKIKELNLDFLMKNLSMPLSSKFMELEYQGVLVNRPYLEKQKKAYETEMERLGQKIQEVTKIKFSVESPAQLSHVLFKRLGLPPVRMGKTSEASDKDVLNKLKDKHPVIPLILQYRETSQIYKTFLKGMLKRLDSGNRIHTEYKIGETDTGRTACVDASTILETSLGNIKIGELDLNTCPGIRIQTHTGRMQKITKKIYKGRAPMFKVILSDGRHIICTGEHRILTENGWKKVYDIKEGETVYSYHGENPKRNNDTRRRKFQKNSFGRKFDQVSGLGKVSNFSGSVVEISAGLSGKVCKNDVGSKAGEIFEGNLVPQNILNSPKRFDTEEALEAAGGFREKCIGNFSNIEDKRIFYKKEHGLSSNKLQKRLPTPFAPTKVGYRLFTKARDVGSWSFGLCKKLLQEPGRLLSKAVSSLPSINANSFFHKTGGAASKFLCGGRKDRKIPNMLEFKSGGNPAISVVGRLQTTAYSSILLLQKVFGGFLFSSAEINSRGRWNCSQVYEKGRCRKEKNNSKNGSSADAFFKKRHRYAAGLGGNLYKEKIIKIIPVGERDVWDITVENDHSYLAHGFVNHNSANPNLQNLPRDNKDIKRAFIARPGYVLYELDFSQVEVRVLAHMSGDPHLRAALHSGVDIHTAMASKVFRVPVEKVTGEMRSKSKSVVFGIIYGMSYKTLAENRGMPEWEAKEVYDNFLSAFPRAQEWMGQVKAFALKNKKVYSLLGRIRHLDAIDHPVYSLRGHAERCAVNTPIQATGADIPNLGILMASELYPETEWDYRLFMQVHDAGYYEISLETEKALIPLLKNCLENTTPLCVPTPVGMKRGLNLGEMREVRIWKSPKTGKNWLIVDRSPK